MDGSFHMMIVPEPASIPPTPWDTEILALDSWAAVGSYRNATSGLACIPLRPAVL
jgi:hypothetical protein